MGVFGLACSSERLDLAEPKKLSSKLFGSRTAVLRATRAVGYSTDISSPLS